MSDTIFLDTVGMIALWNRKDQWHTQAKEAFAVLMAERATFLTSTYVLMECGNSAARYPFRTAVIDLRKELVDSGNLIEPMPSDCEQAWEAFGRGEAGQAGIVDHVSFVLMKRLGLSKAFTNDRHFQAAGFEVLF